MGTLESDEPFIEESIEITAFKEDIIKEILTNGVPHIACFQVPVNSREFKFTAAANWSNKNYAALILYPPGNYLGGDEYTIEFVNSMTPTTQVIWCYKTPEEAIKKINRILEEADDNALTLEALDISDMEYACIDGEYQMC